jgi:hydroxymethylglutaryl-CoA lyase
MRLPKRVTICDVGPRDGLQMIKSAISITDKIHLVDELTRAGLPRIEVGSFVHPKVVPQMADTPAVLAAITRLPRTSVRGLALNLTGVERALQSQVDEVCLTLAASETFQQKNARSSVDEAVDGYRQAVALLSEHATLVQVGIATAFGCPYEGAVSPARVISIIKDFVAMGVTEVSLADTTGMADPAQVYALCCAVRDRWPDLRLGLHLHNTRGLGLANVLAGLQAGITDFDASVGGLGGCPFAPKATGNISTEDLVHMLHAMEIDTGIDLDALIALAHWLHDDLGLKTQGLVMEAGPRTRLYTA